MPLPASAHDDVPSCKLFLNSNPPLSQAGYTHARMYKLHV